MRQDPDAVAGMMQSGAIGYTAALTDYAIEDAADSDVIVDQMANPDIDVLTGLPFLTGDEPEPGYDEMKAEAEDYIASLNTADSAELYRELLSTPGDEYLDAAADAAVSGLTREDIEEMMAEGYSDEMGVDAGSISGYIDGMDDETLMGYVRDMIRETIAEQYAEAVGERLESLSDGQLAMALEMTELEDWQYEYVYNELMPPRYSEGSYEENLDALGYVDLEKHAI